MVSAKSGVGMSYLVRQIEPQRGVSHSTQDDITGSAGPGGEGGAKAAADENLPKTGESGKPSFPLCSGHTALVASCNITQHHCWSCALMVHVPGETRVYWYRTGDSPQLRLHGSFASGPFMGRKRVGSSEQVFRPPHLGTYLPWAHIGITIWGIRGTPSVSRRYSQTLPPWPSEARQPFIPITQEEIMSFL